MIIIIFIFVFSTESFAQKKVALVIGNSDYKEQSLRNPINDARDISQILQNLGFEVDLKLNAAQEDMEVAVQIFGKKLQSNTVGLFYFSGHGVQYEGSNYLIPIGAMSRVSAPEHLRYKAVNAGYVLGVMKQSGSGLNIVILDACRNNPFKSFSRSLNKGLKRMSSAEGTIIAYSTSPGKVALDGNNRNSPYTEQLIKSMKIPNLPVELMLKQVRKSVKAKTGGKQSPWYEASIDGDFYFNQETVQKHEQPTGIKKHFVNLLRMQGESINFYVKGPLKLAQEKCEKLRGMNIQCSVRNDDHPYSNTFYFGCPRITDRESIADDLLEFLTLSKSNTVIDINQDKYSCEKQYNTIGVYLENYGQ